MQNRVSVKNTIYLIKVVGWVIMSLFVLAEDTLIVLFIVVDSFEPSTFDDQLKALTSVVLVAINVSMLVIYVKYAGMPYKSQKHYKGLKHFGFMAGYWTFAFILKLVYGSITSI